jgi:hypothetical protein
VKKIIAVLYAALILAKSEVLTQAKFNAMIDAVGLTESGTASSTWATT